MRIAYIDGPGPLLPDTCDQFRLKLFQGERSQRAGKAIDALPVYRYPVDPVLALGSRYEIPGKYLALLKTPGCIGAYCFQHLGALFLYLHPMDVPLVNSRTGFQ